MYKYIRVSTRPGARLVHEPCAALFETRDGSIEIVNAQRDVMQARPTFFDEFRDR